MTELSPDPERLLEREHVREPLAALLADRRCPEARALYLTLARYIDRRSSLIVRGRYPDLLVAADIEELVGEVLLELMGGALASFRGESLPELLGFVKRVTDRTCWRRARRRIRERDALSGEVGDVVRGWNAELASPDAGRPPLPPCPLDAKDEAWLLELLQAGSRSEHARRQGVSRAAVTQRVQRIKARIAALDERGQGAAEDWMRGEADRLSGARPV